MPIFLLAEKQLECALKTHLRKEETKGQKEAGIF